MEGTQEGYKCIFMLYGSGRRRYGGAGRNSELNSSPQNEHFFVEPS